MHLECTADDDGVHVVCVCVVEGEGEVKGEVKGEVEDTPPVRRR